MTADTTAPDTAAHVDAVQRLPAEGKLRIQPLMDTDPHDRGRSDGTRHSRTGDRRPRSGLAWP
ncbi:hypothetical protein SAMN04488107_0418 [Geodermatophilus saharensis]|uniref:Uncharacterized protein n=1 Tax=Geodermatophilus saharensis TaxID=1137994 RepID=A0A238ZXJ3_9ACTN|nr:hypothetical protein SAMN04488107_0418 [Geodermatophilus saharensis]